MSYFCVDTESILIVKKIILLIFFVKLVCAQTIPTAINSRPKQPKLIIGIVVDQMRQDYIYRYWDKFGSGGFKKLLSGGYVYKNAHFNYVPTYTGPGHACIYTGTGPATNGIIANDWFNKQTGKTLYCVEDKEVKTIGSSSQLGLMSPKNLLTTTIGDELKLFTNQKSKVFSVSLKDRSSILPAGHTANGAFWLDGTCGKFISSSHYMQELPKWLIDFNALELPKKYLSMGWNTLYNINTYIESIADQNAYEKATNGKSNPVFPYDYKKQLEQSQFDVIKSTPFGNTIVKDLALACLKSEALGKGTQTDMLCISFSSTDYVGHAFGPRSVEIEDVYLRLDKDLEELLTYLNTNIGKDNFVLFLTADHGACDVPAYLQDLKIPGGYMNEQELEKTVKSFCQTQYNDSLILNISNQQVFLNDAKLHSMKLNRVEVEHAIAEFLLSIKGIAEAYPADVLKYENAAVGTFKYLIQKGYNHVRSGDIAFSYNPAWMEHEKTGTTHGASYSYDTHVPLIFYGTAIKAGTSVKQVNIVDIAPTVSMLLNIPFPNGTTGKPLEELFGK